LLLLVLVGLMLVGTLAYAVHRRTRSRAPSVFRLRAVRLSSARRPSFARGPGSTPVRSRQAPTFHL
ncbi:hypothetical protein ACWCQE_40220, partial [Streptomyces sp. NPDC002409]